MEFLNVWYIQEHKPHHIVQILSISLGKDYTGREAAVLGETLQAEP